MIELRFFNSKWIGFSLLAALLVALGLFFLFSGSEETYAFNFGRENPNLITSYASFLTDGEDRWVFTFRSGRLILIDLDVEVYGSLMDPVVEVLDSQGNIIAGNDDDFFSLDSSVGFVTKGGVSSTYTIVITDFNGAAGDEDYFYLLNISQRAIYMH